LVTPEESVSTSVGPEQEAAPPTVRRRWWSRLVHQVGWFPLLTTILLGIISGVGAFTFGYGKGASYLSSDPKHCANCHVMQEHYDSWQKSSHHNVATCNDCHLSHHPIGKWVVKGDNGFFHSLAFTLENYHEPIQIKARNRDVTQNACVHCHQETVHQMLPVETGGEMLRCIQCHSDVGHAGRRRGSIGDNPRE
jgi:cytochrome c nitrite reductase small subunit